AVVFAGVVVGAQTPTTARRTTPAPHATPAWTSSPSSPTAPAAATTPVTIGSLRLLDLDPDGKRTFHEQLADEYKRTAAAHETLVLMTNERKCGPCREIEDALSDPRMQAALAHVSLVRVDIDDFRDELESEHM